MSSRYDGKRIFTNNHELYSELLRERGLNYFKHYETMKFRYPTIEEIQDLQLISLIWSQEDRWWKLAAKYYGDGTLWYVLAFFNRLPTDFHVKPGMTVQIPLPLERVLKYMGL
jgi:hypothetical protein